jgi:mono/diheme cytochrome c family protein
MFMPNLAALARIALWSATCAALLGGCALLRAAQRPADDLEVARTPAQVARGQYLVDHVMDCAGCHAGINPATGAVDRTLPLIGGGVYGHSAGLPGEIPAPNITQDAKTGIGDWSDGEIIRAVREGVDRDGKALFPIMPYPEYAHSSDQDMQCVVAYLRTLPPLAHEVPERQLDFPVNVLVTMLPKPLKGPVEPPGEDPVVRGEYLAQLSGCAGCHSQLDAKGALSPDKFMAGGNKLHFVTQSPDEPALVLPNITQDKETGIGAWTDSQIKDAITAGRRPDGTFLRTQMPWLEFSKLSPDDVAALVAYARTVPALKNKVDRTP